MTELIKVRAALLQLLKQAMAESIENIPTADPGAVIEVDQYTLTAMLALLRFHPEEETGKFYSEKIIRLIKGQDKVVEHPKSNRRRPIVVTATKMPSYTSDPWMQVLDLIADYGKFLHEWKEKQKKDSA